MMRLIARTGPGAGRGFPLAKPVTTIGRVAGNDIVLRNPHVSRQHAQIRREGGRFVIVDLGSTNGTFVNGKRVGAPHWLQDGDQVSIGGNTFSFQIEVDLAASATEPPAGRRTLPGRAARPPRGNAALWPIIGGGAGAVLVVLLIFLVFGRRGEPSVASVSPTPEGEPDRLAVTTTQAVTTSEPTNTPTVRLTDTPVPSPTSTSTATRMPTPTSTDIPTPSPTSTPSPTATSVSWPDAVVSVPALNLRAGPGTVYDIVGGLYSGDEVDVLARNGAGNWIEVMTADGTRAWVAAAYVTLNTSPAAIPEAGTVPPTPTPPPVTTPMPLPPPRHGGRIDAGGKAEMVITNDTSYRLTLIFDGPTATTVQLARCEDCQDYVGGGPVSCPSGRPRQQIQLAPGTYDVTARVDKPGVGAFAGTWVLEGNVIYYECFFVVVVSP